MTHLTVDEIIAFVSMTELNRESIELSAAVNGHIRKCEKCLKLVKAFQIIYDEFLTLSVDGDFKEYVNACLMDNKNISESPIEALVDFEKPDEYR